MHGKLAIGQQVLMITIDSASNMIKAVKILGEMNEKNDESDEESGTEDPGDEFMLIIKHQTKGNGMFGTDSSDSFRCTKTFVKLAQCPTCYKMLEMLIKTVRLSLVHRK